MLKKLAVLVSVLFTVSFAFAQSGGTIKGKMLDKDNGEPLPFANVVLMKGGSQIAGTMTDFDGKFTFNALTPGKYNVEATYVGYQPIKVADVVVNGGKITFVPDIKASSGAENLEEFVVIEYEIPLISADQTSSGGIVTAENIQRMAGRSASSIAGTVGGVYSQGDGGGSLSIRGSRSSGTDTYIDGIKVRGNSNLPKSAIEQVAVITGGLPAQFGDVTGGIVNITTKGASKELFGGIEYVTSGFKTGDDAIGLDKFGHNLFAFSLSGPLLTKKDSAGNKKDAIVGFFLSGEAKHEVDPRPTVSGTNFRVNNEKMAELNETPLLQNLSDVGGVIPAAALVRSSDLEESPFRLNVAAKSINLSGKVDITTSKTTNVSIGGSFDYNNRNQYSRVFSLFNSQNNQQAIDRQYRIFGRFTQRFANSMDKENPSLVKDAFITFQVDYTNIKNIRQSEQHKDNFNNYGYIGRFTTTRETVYSVDAFKPINADGTLGNDVNGNLSSINTLAYDFERSEINPILANYTSNYYDVFGNGTFDRTDNMNSVVTGGALINGISGGSIYGLYSGMGAVSNNYSQNNQSQFRVSAQGSATVGNHSIKLGFEYEQRVDRFYNLSNPADLWRVGRELTNSHLLNRDTRVGMYDSTLFCSNCGPGGGPLYTYTFDQFYDGDNHKTFDKKLRASLGLAEQGLDWIDFDSYGPDVWEIDMFTADNLLIDAGGGGVVNYAGYDHTGKKLSGNPSLDDFFNDIDENGNKTRKAPGFKPIYMAGFIQDKFAFDDLIFNVGIRIDRYDANQSVLKDPYSLYPVKTVAEIQSEDAIPNLPSNIGDDYVVYVTDANNPDVNNVVGYRNGDVFYNADGEEISDPSVLQQAGKIQPWLLNPGDETAVDDLSGESFKDYEPQVNISPRIAFSFPISDEALFFAHYDVLTQRPESSNRLDLISYLLFDNRGGNYINNPNLRAEQTIDYELGFQQKLNNYSSLKTAAFYRELRDQVQSTQVVGAYPGNYFTYDNRDFGTIKGLTVTYDLRTRGNISMNASYTLQFADGTGSSTTTSAGLVSSGNGNLRTLIPLNTDQRHRIQLTMDYRYGSKKNYNGPVMFGKDILQNTGINLVMRSGSGTPYTKRSSVNGSGVLSSTNLASPIEGQLNGSRLPFTTTFDMKIDRTIDLKWGKGEDDDKKEASLNVYIQALNLLNARNVVAVYAATGNAEDDGFLAASYQQSYINGQISEDSFRDLYSTKVNNGRFYALPRRLRLGLQLNF